MFSSWYHEPCLRLWKSKAEEPRAAATEVKVPRVVVGSRVAAMEVKVPQVAVKVDQVVVVVKVDQVVVKVDQEVVVVKVVVVMAGVAWAVMLFSPMHLGVHHASMMSFRQYTFPAKLSLQ